MPVRIYYDKPPAAFPVDMAQESGEWIFTQRYESELDEDAGYLDVYALRERFFQVQTPDEALKFLQQSGPFFRLKDEKYKLIKGRGRISWSLFQAMQSRLRFPLKYAGRMLDTGGLTLDAGEDKAARERAYADADLSPWPKEWSRAVRQWAKTETYVESKLDNDIPEITIYPDQNGETGRHELVLDLECQSAYEAILTSMIVDEWAGVENQVCKRCGEIFEKTSKHDKIFCSASCAKKFHKREERRKVSDKLRAGLKEKASSPVASKQKKAVKSR